MKKSVISLLLLPLALVACASVNPDSKPSEENNPTQDNNVEDNSSENQNQEESIPENEGNNPSEKDEDQEEENQIQEEEQHEEKPAEDEEDEKENTGENEGNIQENVGISLDEWKEYEFHNGHEPAYNSDWIFDYGGSKNPGGCLWENPNKKVDYSGIEFSDKKQFLSSPIFNTYPKVEMRFQFWFSAHNKGKSTNGQPTFKIEEYSETEKLINTDTFEIVRSEIPNNNTALEKRIYVIQSSMTHFKLKFNNTIANGSGDYTPILCKISLKGWQYV